MFLVVLVFEIAKGDFTKNLSGRIVLAFPHWICPSMTLEPSVFFVKLNNIKYKLVQKKLIPHKNDRLTPGKSIK